MIWIRSYPIIGKKKFCRSAIHTTRSFTTERRTSNLAETNQNIESVSAPLFTQRPSLGFAHVFNWFDLFYLFVFVFLSLFMYIRLIRELIFMIYEVSKVLSFCDDKKTWNYQAKLTGWRKLKFWVLSSFSCIFLPRINLYVINSNEPKLIQLIVTL